VAAWLLAGVFALAGAERRGRLPRGLFAALAPGLLLRPDAVLFYAVLLAAAAGVPGGRRRALGGALLGALVLGGWCALGVLYYGDPLPNTWYLKATGTPRLALLRFGLAQLADWLPRLAPALALAAAGAFALRARPSARACLGALAAALLYSAWVGGDWSDEYGIRFVVPALPCLFVLAAAGAARLSAQLVAPRAGANAAASAAVAGVLAAAVLASPPAALAEWLDPRRQPQHAAWNRTNYLFARYLERRTDPSTTLGAHWAGVTPYFSRRRAVDVLGKSDRHIAKLPARVVSPGHAKWDWDYVLSERRPDVFQAPSRGLGERADFRAAYVRVVKSPEHYFFMRRDALAKLHDPDVEIVDLRAR
jgi:hypothetical protein